MRRILLLCMILLLLLSAAGCTSRSQTEAPPEETEEPAQPTVSPAPAARPSATPEPVETPEPAATEAPEAEPAYRNPLNGQGMDEPFSARPFAVMINNHSEALPHCGVGDADIVYEVLAEGGITRMMAVFSDISSVERLEAVRSIRPYFLDLAISYGAVICHAGGSDAAYGRIRNEGLNNIDGVRGSYGFTVFSRDQSRVQAGIAVEHTMYTTGEKLYRCATERGYALTVDEDYDAGLRFTADGTPEDGGAAEKIRVVFGYKTTELAYNAGSGAYSAVQYHRDYIDGNTGEKVMFRNVLALFAPTRVIDDAGRLSVNLSGSGEGWFACGGAYVPITWEHTDGGAFHYFLEDGEELALGEGHSYITVLPAGQSSVEFE